MDVALLLKNKKHPAAATVHVPNPSVCVMPHNELRTVCEKAPQTFNIQVFFSALHADVLNVPPQTKQSRAD